METRHKTVSFLKSNSKIIEIGSNDGSFLKNFKEDSFEHLGFEPSKNVADYSKKYNRVNVFNGFFNEEKIFFKFSRFNSSTLLLSSFE